jgi:hypothetical protein
MLMKRIGSLVALVVLFFLAQWALVGCAYFSPKEGGTASSETALKASFSGFEDVLIPSDLSVDRKKSQVYSAGKAKVGLLTFKGRVEPDSLADFFQNNLPRNGWKLMTNLKDRDQTLIFLKDDRVCMITIAEDWWNTVCEVRVGLVEKGPEPGKGTTTR